MMGFDLNRAGQLPGSQDLQPVADLVHYAQLHQALHVEGIALEVIQASQVHDGELLLENVGESALGKTAVQRHLAALESALLAEAGAGALSLAAARGGLAVS